MSRRNNKIAIVGAGAIGGLVAARLARSGQPVSVVARGAQLRAIQAKGLTVLEDDQQFTVQVNATDSPASLGQQDVLLLCLKGQALAQSAASLKPLVGMHTRIVSVMNGIPWWFLHDFGGKHANERLRSVDPKGAVSAVLPPVQACGCVVRLSSSVLSPGVLQRHHGNDLIVGAVDKGFSNACAEVAAVLAAAGFKVSASEDIRRDIWLKLSGNITMNPISALTLSTTDLILGDRLTEKLVVTVMQETKAIGEAFGISLTMTPEERNRITRSFGAMKTSMLQDVESGRSLELDALLGAPIELAQLANVPAPFIEMLFGLVRRLDASLSAGAPASA